MMTNLSRVLIIGLLAATSVTASVAAATLANGKTAQVQQTNVTTIYKSDVQWPVKGLISVDPCNIRACVDA